MRLALAAGLTGLALTSLGACVKPAPAAGGPAALPHRKPGLWTQTISLDGRPNETAIRLCVDAASEAKTWAFRQRVAGGQCPPPQITLDPDGTIHLAESCDLGAKGKTVTTGVIKGDFNSSYTYAIDSRSSGNPNPQLNGEHKLTIAATWTGPCGPGQTGGDMILPDGSVRHPPANSAPAAGN
jgi:hypothetical protein